MYCVFSIYIIGHIALGQTKVAAIKLMESKTIKLARGEGGNARCGPDIELPLVLY